MKKLLFAFLLAIVIHSTSYASNFSKYECPQVANQ